MKVRKGTVAAHDVIQKTWVPEGTAEYRQFKHVTQENRKLVEVIKRHVELKPGDLVLDVGGHDGNVAFAVQDPKWVHIVDPDPTVRLLQKPGQFWNHKIQDIAFGKREKYKLIICCHVLGYLGLQGVQADVLRMLTDALTEDGTLVLFYNTNEGYMGSLLRYSQHVLPMGHFDHFDESLLKPYRTLRFDIKQFDTAFYVAYKSFEKLARCCWFLFGAIDPDIGSCARRFLPKLRAELAEPSFIIDERMLIIKKKRVAFHNPTF
jgi:hypothetical protein